MAFKIGRISDQVRNEDVSGSKKTQGKLTQHGKLTMRTSVSQEPRLGRAEWEMRCALKGEGGHAIL